MALGVVVGAAREVNQQGIKIIHVIDLNYVFASPEFTACNNLYIRRE